ncbi:MAG: DUF2070 family protein [Thermoplasmataceae archaeon]
MEDLSRFVRGAPGWKFYIVPIFILAVVDYVLVGSILEVAIGFILSFILVIIFDSIFIKIGKFHFPLRRIVYLDFISYGLWTVIFWISHLLDAFGSVEAQLFFAVSFVSFFRVLIFEVYYTEKISYLLPPSLNYTYAAIITFGYLFGGYSLIIPFVLSSVISALIAILFARSVLSDFATDYGVSPMKLLQFFLNFRSMGDSDQVGKEFFDRIYKKEQIVPVKVIDIRNSHGPLVSLIFPYVHPGPFGRLGCSDLPIRLQDKLSDMGRELMVFHTSTTHANNCQGENDIDNIASGIREALRKMKYTKVMSRFRKLNAGRYSITLMRFGNFGFGGVVPDLEPFDDIELGEGMRVMEAIKAHGASEFALVDAQNNFTKGANELRDCSDLIKPFTREFVRSNPNLPAKVGFASLKATFPGLAKMGIQTLAINSGERNDAIVLTDSNNVTREVIDMVRKKSAHIVSNVEIYTTDNHIVNASTLDVFPLGMDGDLDIISDLIVGTIRDAVRNTGNVELGMASVDVGVKMGEENSYHKLTASVLSTVKKAKRAIAFTLPLALIISFLLFLIPFSSLF